MKILTDLLEKFVMILLTLKLVAALEDLVRHSSGVYWELKA